MRSQRTEYAEYICISAMSRQKMCSSSKFSSSRKRKISRWRVKIVEKSAALIKIARNLHHFINFAKAEMAKHKLQKLRKYLCY